MCDRHRRMVVATAPVWLTVDSDDIRHLPIHQGHPRRSRRPVPEGCEGPDPSPELATGMAGFARWMDGLPARTLVTLFVIGDQLESPIFRGWLRGLAARHQGGDLPRLTIGVHGQSHRSWSAWPADAASFGEALAEAGRRIEREVRAASRRWFRAPAGYVAPWMAPVLKDHGVVLDSSVNPTPLLRRKTGRREAGYGVHGWRAVSRAMEMAGVVERPWMTAGPAGLLPACGPALHHGLLRPVAARRWQRLAPRPVTEDERVLDGRQPLTTVYWHLLDHARDDGTWTPPMRLPLVRRAEAEPSAGPAFEADGAGP